MILYIWLLTIFNFALSALYVYDMGVYPKSYLILDMLLLGLTIVVTVWVGAAKGGHY